MEAPAGWRYSLFPLEAAGREALSLDRVTEAALALIGRAEAAGDEEWLAPVPHWAHVLKAEQGPQGDWPAVVNARTGEPLGEQRTRSPARLLARLGQAWATSEFDAAVARAWATDHLDNATKGA